MYRIEGQDSALGKYTGRLTATADTEDRYILSGQVLEESGQTWVVSGTALRSGRTFDVSLRRRRSTGLVGNMTGAEAPLIRTLAGTATWNRDALSLAVDLQDTAGASARERWARQARPGTVLVKVMTLNILGWLGPKARKVARLLEEERPDLVGLQEVLRGQSRKIEQLSGYHVAWERAPNPLIWGQGNAVAARGPIHSVAVFRLPRGLFPETRIGMRASVEVEEGLRLEFVNTHLSVFGKRTRMRQAEALLTWLRDSPAASPLVITGDFNARAGRKVHRFLTGVEDSPQGHRGDWVDVWSAARPGETGPTNNKKRIDYIFLDEGSTPGEVRVLASWRRATGGEGDPKISDHRAVLATLEVTLP